MTTTKSMTFAALVAVLVGSGCAEPEARSERPSAAGAESSQGDTAPSAAPERAAPESAASATNSGLTRVSDPSLVCMVNNQFMGRAQIPVEIDGRTYYGCCAMCKGRLERDASARTGTDPVSGRPVDKATAVIGQNAAGQAFYFENEANFAAYQGA